MTRRAKIVCTLGPASGSAAAIAALVDAGMDVARLNLSHGSREEHTEVFRRVRQAAERAGRAVGILADLQGPKIRLGVFAGGSAELETGTDFTLTVDPCLGDRRRASTPYTNLARDLSPGDTLLIDDGRVRLRVRSAAGAEVRTEVMIGGRVSDHKGINLPGVRVSAPALTEKDRQDLHFALSLPVDLIALSFVRSPNDAAEARRAMEESGRTVPVIAKIERPEAVSDLEHITDAFDGLMVARGDLGVEMPLELVPLVQKRAIRLGRERAKPVIVATQMLESMVHHPSPTRAEVSDVANAVLEGADALMLSGETSVGSHALEAVRVMARVIAAAESDSLATAPGPEHRVTTCEEALAAAAARVAHDLGVRALVAFTESGGTARLLARHRETIPLLAFTPEPAVRNRLALTWGVETFVVPRVGHTDEMIALVDRSLLELGRGTAGEWVAIVAGAPPGRPGSTNTLRVHRLGG